MIKEINKAKQNFYNEHSKFADTVYMSQLAFDELKAEAKAINIAIFESQATRTTVFNGLSIIISNNLGEPFLLTSERTDAFID